MGKLFKRGYKESRKEAKRQEERREAMKGQLFRFFLQDDGDEADVRFLTEEPITFGSTTLKRVIDTTVLFVQGTIALFVTVAITLHLRERFLYLIDVATRIRTARKLMAH